VEALSFWSATELARGAQRRNGKKPGTGLLSRSGLPHLGSPEHGSAEVILSSRLFFETRSGSGFRI